MHKIFIVIMLFTSCSSAVKQLTLEDTLLREQKVKSLLSSGNIYLSKNDLFRAEASFALARDLKAKDARILDAFGCLAFRRADMNLAKYYFQQSVNLEPKFDRAIAHLAQVLASEGSIDGAAELYEYALALNPLNGHAQTNYANLILKNKARFNEVQQKNAKLIAIKGRLLSTNIDY